jgi:hypothetical protein
MATGALDGGFVGFRATVAEKGLVGTRVGTQPVGQCGLFRNEIEIGNMMNLFHLILNGLGQVLIVVTKSTSGDATDTIQIILSVSCFQKAPLSGINGQFVAAVYG